MIGFDVKKHIEQNVLKTMEEFAAREDIVTEFGTPLIGYVDARHPLFDIFMDKNMSDHPKNIYRPGITLIVHVLPYDVSVTESNREKGSPSPQWVRAFTESTWLSMAINRAVRGALDMAGRLSSCLNTPLDWNGRYSAERGLISWQPMQPEWEISDRLNLSEPQTAITECVSAH